MPIHDVSLPISARMPIYPGDPEVKIKQWLALDNGDAANVSVIHFGAHTGTHVDAPAHFIKGAPRVDSLPLDVLIGEAQVIDVPPDRLAIDEDFVAVNCAVGAERLLFKSRNSSFWNDPEGRFHSDYTYIEPQAARRLANQGLRLLGFDYLSVEKFKPQRYETHEALLSKGVVIIEGLDLRSIEAGTYELICLPLRIFGGSGDGAPARVVLRTLD